MFSRTGNPKFKTAAWSISFWGALTFSVGTALSFVFLHSFLANDLQKRTDAWLIGELGVLANVAQRTPDTELHDAVIREVAELASRETPSEGEAIDESNHAVFFLLTDEKNRALLHTGSGSPESLITMILKSHASSSTPSDVELPGFQVPFRVVQMSLPKGQHIYLGLSTHYERAVLKRLRHQFLLIWCLMILLGGAIVFVTTRRMLQRVLAVSDTASQIGSYNLATRVPVGNNLDEISQLSATFNNMLDRIQAAVEQLHTMTGTIAHDIRSPITVIRGKLEFALTNYDGQSREELLASTIEELDRITNMLTMSLDVSEANANALNLHKQKIELDELVSSMYDLYEPAFSEAGLSIRLDKSSTAVTLGDSALLQRAITNLFDNELRHLAPGSSILISVFQNDDICILQIEDDGPGFSKELLPKVFESYTRSANSSGYGLGLAFVAATIHSHGGTIVVSNRDPRGAHISISLPRTSG